MPDRLATFPLDRATTGWVDNSADFPRASGYLDALGNQIDIADLARSCQGPTDLTCISNTGADSFFITYQPDSYYWPLQGIVVGIIIVLSTMLLALSTLRLRFD